MYGSLPYALAQGDVEIPYLILQTLVYSVITYWMIRLLALLGPLECISRELLKSCSWVLGLAFTCTGSQSLATSLEKAMMSFELALRVILNQFNCELLLIHACRDFTLA